MHCATIYVTRNSVVFPYILFSAFGLIQLLAVYRLPAETTAVRDKWNIQCTERPALCNH